MRSFCTALLLSSTLVGCSLLEGPVPSVIEPSSSAEASPADLLVFTYPLSGDLVWGLAEAIGGDADADVDPYVLEILNRGYELALSESGGIVAGLRIELVSSLPEQVIADPSRYGIDLSSGSNQFAPAASALLQYDDRLVAVLGPHHVDAVRDGTIRSLCEAGLPMVSGFQGTPSAETQQCPESRFFRTNQSQTVGARTAAEYLALEGALRVLLVVSDYQSGDDALWRSEREAFRSEARQRGLNVVEELRARELTVERVRSSDVDAIALIGDTGPDEASRFWKVAEAFNTMAMVVTESAADYAFSSAGEAVGVTRPLVVSSNYPIASEIPGYTSFVERWLDRYGELTKTNDEYLAMTGYAAMRALLAAIERAREEGARSPSEIRTLIPSRVSSAELSGQPFGTRWGFTGTGNLYPVFGGLYTLDYTIAEDEWLFPLRTIIYQ